MVEDKDNANSKHCCYTNKYCKNNFTVIIITFKKNRCYYYVKNINHYIMLMYITV